MPIWLLIFLSLSNDSDIRVESGRATIYWPTDGSNSGWRADGKVFREGDYHIAHRWIPLGTIGFLCNERTKLCTQVIVSDRGPFGAIRPCDDDPSDSVGLTKPIRITWFDKCYWWQVQTRIQEGWIHRGKFDLTVNVAKEIKHRSFDRVLFVYDRKSSKRISNHTRNYRTLVKLEKRYILSNPLVLQNLLLDGQYASSREYYPYQ
jgi:hypothetical protein